MASTGVGLSGAGGAVAPMSRSPVIGQPALAAGVFDLG
jgi:hypothetical protein